MLKSLHILNQTEEVEKSFFMLLIISKPSFKKFQPIVKDFEPTSWRKLFNLFWRDFKEFLE
jgi:hypothetical protein